MFLVLFIVTIIFIIERVYIAYIRALYINRHRNRFNGLIFVYFRNNIVDIDTGTETCTEVDDNEYKQNYQDTIIYANGFIDIETGLTQERKINDEEFKDFNAIEIRQPVST